MVSSVFMYSLDSVCVKWKDNKYNCLNVGCIEERYFIVFIHTVNGIKKCNSFRASVKVGTFKNFVWYNLTTRRLVMLKQKESIFFIMNFMSILFNLNTLLKYINIPTYRQLLFISTKPKGIAPLACRIIVIPS